MLKVTEMSVASAQPSTDAAPFKAQNQAIKLGLVCIARRMPVGNAIPAANPIGARITTEIRMRVSKLLASNKCKVGIISAPTTDNVTATSTTLRTGESGWTGSLSWGDS